MAKKASPAAASSSLDWKTLKTAKGTATRVPALVQALVGGRTPNDRYQAHFTLNEGLRGDGVVSTSAAATVPLLCQVLASQKPDAHRAAWLVAEALTAGHERVFADPTAQVRGEVDAVHAAVAAAKDTLLEALADPDPLVRAGSAFAVAWAPALADASRPALRRQLAAETSDSAILSQLLALGLLSAGQGQADEDHEAVRAMVTGTRSHLVHGGVALALLLLDCKVEPSTDVKGILSLLQSPYDREGIPWCQGQWNEIVACVGAHGKVPNELAMAVAAGLDPEQPPASWLVPTRALLTLAGFTKKWEKFDVAPAEDLSDAQRAVAASLARRDGLQEVLWGIPRSGRDRRRWLGLTAGGPLEKHVSFDTDGAHHDWPVWRVWRTLYQRGTTQDALPAAIAERLTPDEAFEALLEVDIGAYSIRALAGGGPMPGDVMRRAAEGAGPQAAEWAGRYVDEVLALVAAQSAPELGGELGFKNSLACFIAITKNGGTIEARWNLYVPLHPPDAARTVLERIPLAQREQAIWLKMNQPHLAAPNNDFIVKAILPLLDLVPSKRIAGMLVDRIRTAKPADGEQSLARIRELGAKAPGIAEALTAG